MLMYRGVRLEYRLDKPDDGAHWRGRVCEEIRIHRADGRGGYRSVRTATPWREYHGLADDTLDHVVAVIADMMDIPERAKRRIEGIRERVYRWRQVMVWSGEQP